MAALSTGVELNKRDNDALIRAALLGDVAPIQTWLNAGGDVNVEVHSEPTFNRLLYIAVRNYHAKLVRVLIANGADVNFVESRHAPGQPGGKSALQCALAIPHYDPTEIAKLLIEAGADLFNKDLSEGNPYGDVGRCTTLLFSATRYPDILRALLRAGIRVDGRFRDGRDVEAVLQAHIPQTTSHMSYGGLISKQRLEESARILEGVRLAGSYKRFFLAPHHGMLALRKLVLCGRAEARASPSTSGLDYYQKVFNFYTTEGTGDEGCDDNFVARSLAMDLDQVKDIIEFLSSKGDLYSTIDDDHHKSIHDYLLPPPYPPAVPAVAPSFLLPDPVFFLILQFWLGAY